jgi:hypothetical protein
VPLAVPSGFLEHGGERTNEASVVAMQSIR